MDGEVGFLQTFSHRYRFEIGSTQVKAVMPNLAVKRDAALVRVAPYF